MQAELNQNSPVAKVGKYRWTILALVFFATTINYLDRQVISLLKDDYLEPAFNWTETDYANIVVAFQVMYGVGMLFMGWLIDKLGTKIGYALSLTVWSLAAVAHAFARGTLGFMVARGFLGLSEAGNFPAAIKTVAEWFPKKERALATGLFNSGSNVGAILAPLTVPLIAVLWGWQWAFIITGAIGLIWLVFWFMIYEIPSKHKKLSKEEYEYIHSDKDEQVSVEKNEEKVGWLSLLTYKQTWAFVIGKFLTDPVWWFYLFWLPSFLNKQYGMTKTDLALPIALVYTMTTFGSIFGGWLSGYFIGKGWTVNKARKTAMLIFALFALPVVSAQALGVYSPWIAIVIVGIAASAHQAWSANIFTTTSDMFPKKAVASVTGIGGMAGAVGGILIATLAGWVLDHFKALGTIETGYYVMFLVCGSAYLIAWFIFNLLAPKMERVEI
ncbi:major facilitator superfamily MFS_1 [Melioribacter roseus P3M-2]|uniref:Major facilitator superfamily MFS_1 n=1 Tax=Melioribacter roseus (strain DSM 23840 / JCM 17771 / VKM B-2668 / P3M-2) TaxID=1191523 RepID=I7A6P8_MELRP|nr:MFS transporter [Melioribacter roseus]AFN75556.1 major facilitator superfamily MFS_1 [Melioribacter roseus P3M-2]